MMRLWRWRRALVWWSLVALVAYGYYTWHNRALSYLSYSVSDSLGYVSLNEIDEALAPYLAESFWGVDLNVVRESLETISWVHSARVKRSWPGYIEISLVEHQPVARWGADALITAEGTIFKPNRVDDFADLVRLDGEPIQAKPLLSMWQSLQASLAKIEWRPLQISQQVDGVVEIAVDNGLLLFLDRVQWQEKIDRFVRAYPQISPQIVESAQSFDLRYSNGLAVELNANIVKK